MTEVPELVSSQKPEKAFVFPTRTLKFLGGILEEVELPERTVTMVKEGAYLWGVDNLKTGKGVFEHVCLASRKGYWMAEALKEKSEELGDGKYADLDPNRAAELVGCHDAGKLHSGYNPKPKEGQWVVGRENLDSKEKERLGLPPDYREISPEADQVVVAWLEKAGFPEEFAEVIIGHDFPQTEEAIDSPYKMLVQIADYSVGQEFMTVRERWNDVAERWVKAYVKNWDQFEGEDEDTVDIIKKYWQEFEYEEGKPPRIEPERLVKSVKIVQIAADTVFGYLGITEQEFTEKYRLKEDSSMPPWEKVLRKAWKRDHDYQEKGEQGAPEAERVKGVLKGKGK